MIWLAAFADAAEVRPPITEIDHPGYVDAAGAPVPWTEVRTLAADSGALGRIRRRKIGRTILRITFAAATAAEVWGTTELGRNENWAGVPLGTQAAFTGLCEVLLWTSIPQYRVEDRAIVLDAANSALLPR